MVTRSASNRKHIIQRHGNIGHNNLPCGLSESFGFGVRGNLAVVIDIFMANCFKPFVAVFRIAQFAPHFPTHPEKKNATHQHEADHLQKLHCNSSKNNPQNCGSNNANQNCLAAQFLGQARSSHADHNGIITRQNQIDHNNFKKCDHCIWCK